MKFGSALIDIRFTQFVAVIEVGWHLTGHVWLWTPALAMPYCHLPCDFIASRNLLRWSVLEKPPVPLGLHYSYLGLIFGIISPKDDNFIDLSSQNLGPSYLRHMVQNFIIPYTLCVIRRLKSDKWVVRAHPLIRCYVKLWLNKWFCNSRSPPELL